MTRHFRMPGTRVKEDNKQAVADQIQHCANGVVVDPKSHVRRPGQADPRVKRQHLNVLHIITLYNRIKANPDIGHHTPPLFLWWQGSTRLFHGQTDDQADQLGSRGD